MVGNAYRNDIGIETIKIMTCLDMKEGRLVKGIHFVDLKDEGDP
jgi:cyclase